MNDFLNSLVHEVKEEVVNNYFHERLILESEVERYKRLKSEVEFLETQVLLVFQVLLQWVPLKEVQKDLLKKLFVGNVDAFKKDEALHYTYLIPKVRGMTMKRRYVNVLKFLYQETYDIHHDFMKKREDVNKECTILNHRIVHFQANYDLLTIFSFMRNMDLELQVKKKFLGYNFDAQEIGSMEQQLFIKKVLPPHESCFVEKMPEPLSMAPVLEGIGQRVFSKNRHMVKNLFAKGFPK